MKLAHVFAKYLYQQKTLSLPGIGIFSIDPTVSIPETIDKNTPDFRQFIRFEQKPVAKPADDFIEFIRVHTGKIRPLAESDLESFLSDGKLLLNIGKPFFIDGIGTLQKNREGIYEFAPGEPVIERLEGEKGGEKIVRPKSSFDSGYSQIERESTSSRKLLIALGIIVGLTAIVWGGYVLYNKNVAPLEAEKTNEQLDSNVRDSGTLASPVPDSAQVNDSLRTNTADSTLSNPVVDSSPGSYKFILEATPNKSRALKRIAFLNTLSPRMKLETSPDSSLFKIYVVLPGTPADSTRMKDSLNAWYYGKKEVKVTIEK